VAAWRDPPATPNLMCEPESRRMRFQAIPYLSMVQVSAWACVLQSCQAGNAIIASI
jgi:hypothetical protein